MTAHTLLTALLGYKASADDALLDALETLDPDAASADYQSALRVLHHIHRVDCIFAANLQRQQHAYAESWSREALPLVELSSAIRDMDRWYLDHAAGLDDAALEEVVDFVFTDGQRGRMSREEMLGHVITHGGYHRGEIGRLLPEIESTAMRDVFAGYLHETEPRRREA